MLVKTHGAAVQGIDAITVTIEVSARKGVGFSLVGMADTAVKESYQRVVTALTQSGFTWPRCNMVVNLAPADVRKEGAAYDLPIALCALVASEQVRCSRPIERFMIMGELSLDGTVLPIRGALPMAIKAREMGFQGMIVPAQNADEAAVVNNLEVYGVSSLIDVVRFFSGELDIAPTVVNTREEFARASGVFDFDFSEVKGQESVKRALEVACAGGHNILLVGLSRLGQVDDGQASSHHSAAALALGGSRDHQNPLGGRQAQGWRAADDLAAVPLAPPHDLACSPCGGRLQSDAGRDLARPQRSPLS